MNDINLTVMTGRLTDKPDLVGNNSDIMKFTVAVSREVKDGDSWKSEASFYEWTRFKTSEKFAALFQKGDKVTVKGRATVSQVESKKYKDKDGKFCKYNSISFICDSIDGISIPEKRTEQSGRSEAPAPKQQSAKGPEEWNDEDDIPF